MKSTGEQEVDTAHAIAETKLRPAVLSVSVI